MIEQIKKIIEATASLFILVVCVSAFIHMIKTGTEAPEAIKLMLDDLPFAEEIVEIIEKYLGFRSGISPIAKERIVSELLKLSIMAILQPLAVKGLSNIFFRSPLFSEDSHSNRRSYRFKEIIVMILSAPYIAYGSAHIAKYIPYYLNSVFDPLLASVMQLASIAAAVGISTALLVAGGTVLAVALIWRISVNLLGNMILSLGISVLCWCLYISIKRGLFTEALFSVGLLILFIVIVKLILNLIMRKLAGLNLKIKKS